MNTDARLTAIALIDAAANGNSVNFRKASEWMQDRDDFAQLVIALFSVADALRCLLAEAKGLSVEEVDGLLISTLGAA